MDDNFTITCKINDICPPEYQQDVQELADRIIQHKKVNGRPYEWSMKDFEIGRPLGKGGFGRVYLAREKTTHFLVALKILCKSNIEQCRMENQVLREIEVNKRLIHPNIIRLLTYFYDEEQIVLVLEYAGGGELFRHLKRQVGKKFSEKVAANYMEQLVSALEYCHKNNVIHRDIKPENVLLSIDGNIKLADFGSSVHTPTMKRITMCGTTDYLPPEVIENKPYDEKVDVWCLGVLCYELLVGTTPFDSSSKKITLEKIKTIHMEYPPTMSNEAKDLIFNLLKYDPNERLSLEQVKNHPWIRQMKLQ